MNGDVQPRVSPLKHWGTCSVAEIQDLRRCFRKALGSGIDTPQVRVVGTVRQCLCLPQEKGRNCWFPPTEGAGL